MVKVLLIVSLAILAVVFGPLASIWALNTLFTLAIPYTIDTWMASFILGAVVSGQGLGLTFKK